MIHLDLRYIEFAMHRVQNGRNASTRESNMHYWTMVLCTQILIDLMERFIGRVNDYLLYSAYYR